MEIVKRVAMAALLVFAASPPAWSQTKPAVTPSVADLEREITRLRAELAACNAKEAAAPADTRRTEALASLRAVRSAISTGANFNEFKKYQIESRIKVDALPDVPANRSIREISELYKDAVIFGITNITGAISISTIQDARAKYENDPNFRKVFSEQMYSGDDVTRGQRELNKIAADTVIQILMRKVDLKFRELDEVPRAAVTTAPRSAMMSAGGEALRALKALQSATQTHLGYRDYSRLALDTRAEVDRFSGDPTLRTKLDHAMALYELASRAWYSSIRKDGYTEVARDPVLSLCPSVTELVKRVGQKEGFGMDNDTWVALTIGESGRRVLWSCASDKIAEAEKLLSGEKK